MALYDSGLETFFFFVLLGLVSRKSRKVSCQTCVEKLIFLHVFNTRKTKKTAKFEGLEPRRCEDKKAIVAPEISPKTFGTLEKHAPGLCSIITDWLAISQWLLYAHLEGSGYVLHPGR